MALNDCADTIPHEIMQGKAKQLSACGVFGEAKTNTGNILSSFIEQLPDEVSGEEKSAPQAANGDNVAFAEPKNT